MSSGGSPPSHGAADRAVRGAVSPGWSFRRLRTYPVRIVGDEILVDATRLIGPPEP